MVKTGDNQHAGSACIVAAQKSLGAFKKGFALEKAGKRVMFGPTTQLFQTCCLLSQHSLDPAGERIHGTDHPAQLPSFRQGDGDEAPGPQGLGLVNHLMQWVEDGFQGQGTKETRYRSP